MWRQEKESLEIDREGSGERIVPGACKAFISVVKKKGQRRGGGLETLPGVSRYWAQLGRPSWCSKHMIFTKKLWWPTVQGISWRRVTHQEAEVAVQLCTEMEKSRNSFTHESRGCQRGFDIRNVWQ